MKNSNVILIVISLAVVAGLFWLLAGNQDDGNNTYQWFRTLQQDGNEPYDLGLFNKTLKETWGAEYHEIPQQAELEKYQQEMNDNGAGIYFFTGRNIYLTQNDCEFLEKFVHDGGTVFISAYGIPKNLFKQFNSLKYYYTEIYYSDTAQAYFTNRFFSGRPYRFIHQIRNKKADFADWGCFSPVFSMPDDESFQDPDEMNTNLAVISRINNTNGAAPDFLCLYHGQGRIFLHANPVFFSNLYLTKPEGREYLQKIIGHLPKDHLWVDRSAEIRKPESQTGKNTRSIIDFILQNEALKHAWWILIGGVALFLLAGGRRKQRSIPVIRPETNHALDLVQAIGHFYRSEKHNLPVFKREWNQFLAYLRFHVHWQPVQYDATEAEILASRTGVSKEIITDIFDSYRKYQIFSEITQEELTIFSSQITTFYTAHKNKYGK